MINQFLLIFFGGIFLNSFLLYVLKCLKVSTCILKFRKYHVPKYKKFKIKLNSSKNLNQNLDQTINKYLLKL